jgi:hypothetical protein
MQEPPHRSLSPDAGSATSAPLGEPRVFNPGLKETILTLSAQQCPRLGAAEVGLTIGRKDVGDLAFTDLIGVAAFADAKDPAHKLKLMVCVRDHPRPYLVSTDHVAFREFPGVVAETIPASLRNFLRFLLAHNPALTFESATWEFTANPQSHLPQRDPLALATGIARWLQHPHAEDEQVPAVTTRIVINPPLEPKPNHAALDFGVAPHRESTTPSTAETMEQLTIGHVLIGVTAQLDKARVAIDAMLAAHGIWREAAETHHSIVAAANAANVPHERERLQARALETTEALKTATERLRTSVVITLVGHGIGLELPIRTLRTTALTLEPALDEDLLDRLRFLPEATVPDHTPAPLDAVLEALIRAGAITRQIDAARELVQPVPPAGSRPWSEPGNRAAPVTTQTPGPLLTRAAELLGEALVDLPVPTTTRADVRPALAGAVAHVKEHARQLGSGVDEQGRPLSPTMLGLQLAVLALGVEDTVVSALDTVPSMLGQALDGILTAARLLLGDVHSPQVRHHMALQAQTDATLLRELLAKPDSPLPRGPVRIAPALEIALTTVVPDYAATIVRAGTDELGRQIALAAAASLRRLAEDLGRGVVAATIQRHCTSHWTEIWWAFQRLRAVAFVIHELRW